MQQELEEQLNGVRKQYHQLKMWVASIILLSFHLILYWIVVGRDTLLYIRVLAILFAAVMVYSFAKDYFSASNRKARKEYRETDRMFRQMRKEYREWRNGSKEN